MLKVSYEVEVAGKCTKKSTDEFFLFDDLNGVLQLKYKHLRVLHTDGHQYNQGE
jgi:hypothetical protein